MKSRYELLFLFLLISTIAACAAPAAAPTVLSVAGPTPTQVTATTVPQTNPPGSPLVTPLLRATPTPFRVVPSSAVSETLHAALAKLDSLKSYRGESHTAFGPIPPTDSKADVHVPDSHYFLSVKGQKDAEVIRAGDKLFLKNSEPGGTPAWFLVPPAKAYLYPNYSGRGAVPELVGDLSYYSKQESVMLDGLNCDVYVQDKRAAAGTFFNILGTPTQPSDEAASFFDRAEARMWLCPDGYVHQISLVYLLKPQNEAPQGDINEISVHLYDFDADITVLAPTDVGELPGEPAVPTETPPPPTPTVTGAQAAATAQAPADAQALLQASAGWKTVLTDSFDTTENNWDTTKGKQIANGKYSWDIQQTRNIFRGLPKRESQPDFAASIDAKFVGGSTECGYGITFRNHEYNGYMFDYVFYIHDDQRWGFDIISSPDPGIATGGTSAAIHTGAVNRITVIAQQKRFTFFVNDIYVGQVVDGHRPDGNVGAAVWSLGRDQGCQVEFDNYVLRVPPPSAQNDLPPTPAAPSQLVTSGFDSANTANFPLGEYTEPKVSGKREIIGDTYHWHTRAGEASEYQYALPAAGPVSDFTVSVNARRVGGAKRAAYGLVLKHSDPDTEYVFKVSDFGDFAFSLTENGEYGVLQYPTKSTAIVIGEPNVLKVVAIGSLFQFYINGQLVSEINDATLAEGTVGIMTEVYDAGTEADFEFSDFKLTTP